MATEPTPTDALEPCPFCGGEARHLPGKSGYWIERVICDACHFHLLEMGSHTAVERWNRRAQPAPAASQKPLTVGRIKEICRQHIARDKSKDEPNTGAWPDSVALARAVERAHGIGTKGGRNVDHPV